MGEAQCMTKEPRRPECDVGGFGVKERAAGARVQPGGGGGQRESLPTALPPLP